MEPKKDSGRHGAGSGVVLVNELANKVVSKVPEIYVIGDAAELMKNLTNFLIKETECVKR